MIVDSHQHFWDLEREPMPWMREEHAVIARTFGPSDLRPLLGVCGVDTTILVQAACTDADTDAMFEQAAAHAWIGAVTAWVDLSAPELAAARLEELATRRGLRGVRHLIHEEDDPHWILRGGVLESLALVEERGLVLELPCVYPRHLGDVPALARRFPELSIVIDHLGKPPLGSGELGHWAALIRAAAAFDNVAAKVSGLNVLLPSPTWRGADLGEAVEVALDAFGPDRLMCGSDWPVSLLNGDYETVWGETSGIVTALAGEDGAERILGGTAARIYRLGDDATTHTEPGDAHGRPH